VPTGSRAAALTDAQTSIVPVYAQTGADTGNSQQVKNMSSGDEATAKRVNAALQADPKSYYRRVTVVAQNGVVTLSGLVTGEASRAKAKQIASSVQGVSRECPRSSTKWSCSREAKRTDPAATERVS